MRWQDAKNDVIRVLYPFLSSLTSIIPGPPPVKIPMLAYSGELRKVASFVAS